MKAISEIIDILSEEDKRGFIQFLHQKNRRSDTKNVQLFKAIDAGTTKKLDEQLYGRSNRNAFHALCKRLQDNLIDFIASKSFETETSEELEVLKLLLSARILFEHKKHKTGFKILIKAENKALEFDLYSILNEIYHTKIQYAHLAPKASLSEIIVASEENNRRFNREQKLNRTYATIKQKLKCDPHKPINEIIIESFAFFDIEIDQTLTYKSLYQLMNIIATAAKLKSDYHNVAAFMAKAYTIIDHKEHQADKYLFYRLEILNLMALTHFRNKDFEKSKAFTNKLAQQMQKGYTKRFEEKHTLLIALNETYTGHLAKALHILRGFRGSSLQLQLTMIMCLFQDRQYKESYQIIKTFNHSDSYYTKKAGWIWVLKKNIIEILLLIEMDRLDTTITKLERFKRHFTKPLQQVGEHRVITFIKLVDEYYKQPKLVTSKAFKDIVENSFEWIGAEKEDVFVMNFYAWLKAKMEDRDPYEVVLELVNQENKPI